MCKIEFQIVYEAGEYFAVRVPKGFEVYRQGLTHAERCAHIGYTGEKGWDRMKQEIERRRTANPK